MIRIAAANMTRDQAVYMAKKFLPKYIPLLSPLCTDATDGFRVRRPLPIPGAGRRAEGYIGSLVETLRDCGDVKGAEATTRLMVLSTAVSIFLVAATVNSGAIKAISPNDAAASIRGARRVLTTKGSLNFTTFHGQADTDVIEPMKAELTRLIQTPHTWIRHMREDAKTLTASLRNKAILEADPGHGKLVKVLVQKTLPELAQGAFTTLLARSWVYMWDEYSPGIFSDHPDVDPLSVAREFSELFTAAGYSIVNPDALQSIVKESGGRGALYDVDRRPVSGSWMSKDNTKLLVVQSDDDNGGGYSGAVSGFWRARLADGSGFGPWRSLARLGVQGPELAHLDDSSGPVAGVARDVLADIDSAQSKTQVLEDTGKTINVGPTTVRLTPDAMQKVKETLLSGRPWTVGSGGFGTYHVFMTKPAGRPASPELSQLVGKPVFYRSDERD